MKSIFIAFLLMVVCTAQSQKIIRDANVEARTVGSFSGISVSDGIDLYLSAGAEALAVSADNPDHNARIKTEIKNGVMRIYYNDKRDFRINMNNSRMRAYVSYKTLKSIEASGGSDVQTEGTVRSTELVLSLSGGSDFSGAVDTDRLIVKQSGGCDISISGKATNLVVDASGGSDFEGYELKTEVCHISASGGSDVQINANKEITAKASGASDISYKGNPQVKEVSASGASSVKAKS